jgi:hypothetical protein
MMKAFYLRAREKDNTKAEIQKSWEPTLKYSKGETVAEERPSVENPPPSTKLRGPFGDLRFLLESTNQIAETSWVTLKNIFWTEAVIEDVSAVDSSVAIVKIELADERIIWGMGGYVFGDYNRTVNALEESAWGDLLVWDPQTLKLTNTKDMDEALTGGDPWRPLLDPESIMKNIGPKKKSLPWSLRALVDKFFQQLPGPPKLEIISKNIDGKVPYNLKYGGGLLAKKAIDDLFQRYDLVLCPTYDGSLFSLYDRVQSQKPAGRSQFSGSEDAIPEEYRQEGYVAEKSITLDLEPLSVEIIGERVVEEVQCPNWINVVKDVGYIEKKNGLLGRQGQWIPANTFMDAHGIDNVRARRAVIANWDKDESSAFEEVVPKTISDEIRKQIISSLHAHLFKSYMVNGAFRKFLPMQLERAEGASHALNFGNMSLPRGAAFFSDAWTPTQERRPGRKALFGNRSLMYIDETDLAMVDAKKGVVTFKEVMGTLVYSPTYAFKALGDGHDLDWLLRAIENYKEDALALSTKIQEVIDGVIYRGGDKESKIFTDSTYEIRKLMLEFFKGKRVFINVDSIPLSYDPKTFAKLAEDIAPVRVEKVALPDGGEGDREVLNLTECTVIEPRIIGIWSWYRSYGRSDDYYRYRAGSFPEAPAFPIKVKGLTQFIAINGATNKKALDTLSEMQAQQYLSKAEKPIAGGQFNFIGFWPLTVCGTRPEVVFKLSLQDPPEATTISSVNRFMHGIEGRPPAVATQSAHMKPFPREGGAQ